MKTELLQASETEVEDKAAMREEERALWVAFQSGDQEAFATLYRNYIHVIYNYCRKFADNEVLIEDCVHGLFLDMWKSREQLSVPTSVRFYLYACVKRRIFKEIAKKKDLYLEDCAGLEAAMKDSDASVEDYMMECQDKALQTISIQQGMLLLSDNQRKAIHLKYYKNLTFQEISYVMKMSTDNIYKLVSRGINVLKRNVKNMNWSC